MDTDKWNTVMRRYAIDVKLIKRAVTSKIMSVSTLIKVIIPIMTIDIICTHKHVFSEAIL